MRSSCAPPVPSCGYTAVIFSSSPGFSLRPRSMLRICAGVMPSSSANFTRDIFFPPGAAWFRSRSSSDPSSGCSIATLDFSQVRLHQQCFFLIQFGRVDTGGDKPLAVAVDLLEPPQLLGEPPHLHLFDSTRRDDIDDRNRRMPPGTDAVHAVLALLVVHKRPRALQANHHTGPRHVEPDATRLVRKHK